MALCCFDFWSESAVMMKSSDLRNTVDLCILVHNVVLGSVLGHARWHYYLWLLVHTVALLLQHSFHLYQLEEEHSDETTKK